MRKYLHGKIAATITALAVGTTVLAVTSTPGISNTFAPGESDLIVNVSRTSALKAPLAKTDDDSELLPAATTSLICWQDAADRNIVHAKWEPVTTYSDGTPLPEGTEVYYLFASSADGFGNKVTTSPGMTEVSFTDIVPVDCPQQEVIIGIWTRIKNADGEWVASSDHVQIPFMVGERVQTPFLLGDSEDYQPEDPFFYPHTDAPVNGNPYLFGIVDPSPGGDKGMVVTNLGSYDRRLPKAYSWGFYAMKAGDMLDFILPNVQLDEAPANPKLLFYYCQRKIEGEALTFTDDDTMDVQIWCDGECSHDVVTVDGINRSGWEAYERDLTEFAGKQITVVLRFCTPTMRGHYIYFDEILIENNGGRDFAATEVIMPEVIFPGEEFEIKAVVENVGANRSKNMNVILMRDGKPYDSVHGVPSIEAGEKAEVVFNDMIAMGEGNHTYSAVVSCIWDENEANNTSPEVTAGIDMAAFPSAANVSVAKGENHSVVVTWDQPATSYPIEGYYVYRNGEQLTDTPVAGTTWTDAQPQKGTSVYGVAAVYSFGAVSTTEAEPIELTRDDIGYPQPSGLTGQHIENTVVLNWVSPQDRFNTEPTTESFEDYGHLEYQNLAPWTMIDGDGNPAGDAYPDTNFRPTEGTSWFAVDGTDMNDYLKAHSGKMFLSTLYDNNEQAADWLISPELADVAQTVEFWLASGMYGNEEVYTVYYSTTTPTIPAFLANRAVKSSSVDQNWTKVTVDLPAEARYFAILSNPYYYLKLDDVTYIPAAKANVRRAAATDDDERVVGFNIYREGTLLNDTPVKEETYTDTELPENNGQTVRYVVTAVYSDGNESDPVTGVDVLLRSGIASVVGDNSAGGYRYFNLQGVPVARPAAGSIYIRVDASGRAVKVLVK